MANNICAWYEKEILDHMLGVGSYTMPTNINLGLFKADPGETGDLTNEVTGGAYARQPVTFTAAAGQPAATSNAADVTFPQATADWGTVTHIGIMNATTSGTMLWYGGLTASKTVNSGDTFKVPTGDLDVTLN
jgi:hypothetical protein